MKTKKDIRNKVSLLIEAIDLESPHSSIMGLNDLYNLLTTIGEIIITDAEYDLRRGGLLGVGKLSVRWPKFKAEFSKTTLTVSGFKTQPLDTNQIKELRDKLKEIAEKFEDDTKQTLEKIVFGIEKYPTVAVFIAYKDEIATKLKEDYNLNAKFIWDEGTDRISIIISPKEEEIEKGLEEPTPEIEEEPEIEPQTEEEEPELESEIEAKEETEEEPEETEEEPEETEEEPEETEEEPEEKPGKNLAAPEEEPEEEVADWF